MRVANTWRDILSFRRTPPFSLSFFILYIDMAVCEGMLAAPAAARKARQCHTPRPPDVPCFSF